MNVVFLVFGTASHRKSIHTSLPTAKRAVTTTLPRRPLGDGKHEMENDEMENDDRFYIKRTLIGSLNVF